MRREFLDYVEDIIKAMEDALSFVEGVDYGDFVKDKKTIYAVIRALEVIGEAVKKIPISVRKHYPEIPWKEMAGMRDKLIHEYFGVDLKRVWKTVKEDIPNLKPLFEKILRDFESGNKG
ncbi:MAG: DUF86 domain-containing protein [Archaeoglobaceae archaeon]